MELILSLELWQCFVWLFDMDNWLLHVKLTVFFRSLIWRFVINISI